MPNRIIREGILSSESVCSLSWAEEILYRRLMSIVDDYGRMEANTKWIRARCYPLQIDKVSTRNLEDWINSLVINNLIVIYEIQGKRYLEISKFNQRDRGRESKFPSPPPNAANGSHPPPNAALSVSVSVSEGVSVSEAVIVNCDAPPKAARSPKNQKSKFAAKPESIEECVMFVTEKLQLPQSDGTWFWDHGMAAGWLVNGRRIASWKHLASNWKAQRYFPSLKDRKP